MSKKSIAIKSILKKTTYIKKEDNKGDLPHQNDHWQLFSCKNFEHEKQN